MTTRRTFLAAGALLGGASAAAADTPAPTVQAGVRNFRDLIPPGPLQDDIDSDKPPHGYLDAFFEKAAAIGGTWVFPAGLYRFQDTIRPSPGMVLQGAGIGVSTLGIGGSKPGSWGVVSAAAAPAPPSRAPVARNVRRVVIAASPSGA